MNRDLEPQSRIVDPTERPWQFSLLQLFGLTTVVAVGAAAFYWNAEIGVLVSFTLFLSIATFYRTKAVVRTAAPSFRARSLANLTGFGIFTSIIASLASLVTFCLTYLVVRLGFLAVPWSADPFFIGLGSVLGSITGLIVLYRSWPRRPAAK